jgi:hypothetical protein
MGYTVYADWYVRQSSARRAELVRAVSGLAEASLFVLHAEPITVKLDGLNDLLEPVPRFERLAWCNSKISYAINPRLAEVVFIIRMKRLAKRFASDCLVHIKDDGEDFGEVRNISSSRLGFLFMAALVESPLWLVMWIRGLV